MNNKELHLDNIVKEMNRDRASITLKECLRIKKEIQPEVRYSITSLYRDQGYLSYS